MKVFKTNPYKAIVNEFLIDSPAPVNINYFYNLGSLQGLNQVILIITGISLAKHYNPSVELAFSSSEHIVRDVNNGYLLRYIHANGVSLFFMQVYVHIGKGLYYGSYRAPRRALWIVGVLIFIIKKAEQLAKILNILMTHIKFSIIRGSSNAFIEPRVRANKRIGPHNQEVQSILVGSLLGDGHKCRISESVVRMRFEQGEEHKDYIFWQHRQLKNHGYVSAKPVIERIRIRNGVERNFYYFYTYNFTSLTFLHNEFYGYPTHLKRLPVCPKQMADYLTPLALAIWIKDAGGTQKSGLTLETHCFSLADVIMQCNILKTKYNIDCAYNKTGTINQFRIRIKEGSKPLLAKIIKPHLHKSKHYKLRNP